MQEKLIIWDFDGVIADTDSLWMKLFYQKMVKECSYTQNFEDFYNMCSGMSAITMQNTFAKIGYKLNLSFFGQVRDEFNYIISQNFPLIENADTTIKNMTKKQCLATGTPISKIAWKVSLSNLSGVFNEKNSFSSELVTNGKPAPDIFLYAAQKMGFEPQNCVVIEDSLVGLQAAINASMMPIAFVGCQINNTQQRIEKIKSLGVKHIFFDFKNLEKFISSL